MTSSESQSVPNSIEQVIAELGEKLEITGEQIADVLWLTLELIKNEGSPSQESLESHRLEEDTSPRNLNQSIVQPETNKPITPSTPSQKEEFKTEPSTEKKGSVYSASSSRESQGLTIGIPDAPSLREPLTLAHAFRPLMRRVATGRKLILDEVATVQRIAEEGIFIPVLRAEPEAWLDLALVIDESHSMLIWGHTIRELKEIFKKYGIFRDIRIWALQPDEAGDNLQLFSRMGSNKRLTEPKEIIDPTGRRLIVIVSDCVSNIWRKGMMFPVLKDWTQKQPLVILQMLPEWMWRRTALDLGTAVAFKSSIIGAVNQELALSKPLRRSKSIGFKVEERSKIPVITLDREHAAQWSQMLVGKADALVPGYLLPPKLEIEVQKQQNTTANLDAAERVHYFRMATSPLGRELAGLLAASPVINLPVVRLIQESLLPKSNQVQVAEVFLGGLLQLKSASLKDASPNPDLVEYEFITPEIRDIFLDDAPVSDSVDVVNAVSCYVAEQLGVSLSEFMAILKAPQKVEEKQIEDTIKPFAKITARVLRKLGGEYVKFAEELEFEESEQSSLPQQFENQQEEAVNVEPGQKLYALLIGIDFYFPGKLPDGTFYQNINGCVADVTRVEEFLQSQLSVPEECIIKLTSSNTDSGQPLEPSELLPTYENIVAKFHAITEIAQKDDQVYIHYCGHGGRAKTIYPELKGAGQPDEALVPMDIVKTNERYLRDLELAKIIQNMVDKGLFVTVVLDSSHSGGVRLPESKGYVLLAACRPSEFAYESVFDGKKSSGALTYWFLDSLQKLGTKVTYKSLYDRVYAKVQSQFPSQTPMLFGEGERQVFGRSYANVYYTVNVLKVDTARNRVQLDAGSAQGLGEGARFAIYAPGTTDFSEKNKPLAIAQVTADITPADAWAVIDPDSSFDAGDIEQASPAIMLSAPIALVRRVRLFEKQEDSTNQLPKNQVLPSELLKIQTAALTTVKAAIPRTGKGWVELVSEGEHYQVAINASGEYEICDRNGTPFPNLRPPLLVSDADAAENVVKRLVHLTKYQAAQELENISVLTNKLVVQLTDKDKKPLADPTKQTLQTGENTFLYIKNESKQDLNVVVMDLQSDWAISQLDILEDGASFATFNPGKEELIPLKFKLPEGYQEGKNILKVFATVRPAKFRWLELPSLDKLIQARKASFDEYDENTPRGGGDPLDKLLSAISADPDEVPPTREAQVMSSNRGWTTKTVTITVKAV
jgi:hypothetical protein